MCADTNKCDRVRGGEFFVAAFTRIRFKRKSGILPFTPSLRCSYSHANFRMRHSLGIRLDEVRIIGRFGDVIAKTLKSLREEPRQATVQPVDFRPSKGRHAGENDPANTRGVLFRVCKRRLPTESPGGCRRNLTDGAFPSGDRSFLREAQDKVLPVGDCVRRRAPTQLFAVAGLSVHAPWPKKVAPRKLRWRHPRRWRRRSTARQCRLGSTQLSTPPPTTTPPRNRSRNDRNTGAARRGARAGLAGTRPPSRG